MCFIIWIHLASTSITMDLMSLLVSVNLDITPLIILIMYASIFISTLYTFVIFLLKLKVRHLFISFYLNVTIKFISNIIFSILYYNGNYENKLHLIFSYISIGSTCILPFLVMNDIILKRMIYSYKWKPSIKTIIFELNEPSSCVICIDEFEPGETINETRCGHIYHLQCMERLLKNKFRTCPLCRADLYQCDIIV